MCALSAVLMLINNSLVFRVPWLLFGARLLQIRFYGFHLLRITLRSLTKINEMKGILRPSDFIDWRLLLRELLRRLWRQQFSRTNLALLAVADTRTFSTNTPRLEELLRCVYVFNFAIPFSISFFLSFGRFTSLMTFVGPRRNIFSSARLLSWLLSDWI